MKRFRLTSSESMEDGESYPSSMVQNCLAFLTLEPSHRPPSTYRVASTDAVTLLSLTYLRLHSTRAAARRTFLRF